MLIRQMKSVDLELIIAFEKEYRELDKEISIPFNEEVYRTRFMEMKIEDYPSSKTFLYIEDNKVVGKIDVLIEKSLSNFKIVGYIDWVTVLKTKRNKGIAKALLLEVEDYFREEKCELYYLFVDDTDIAKGFYNKIELKQENIIRGYKML